MTFATPADLAELEAKVKQMYTAVAKDPDGDFHFEMGRELAERLGYPTPVLNGIPGGAVESFAGVGYFFDLADLKEGELVLDLGSGAGMDAFFAALQVGEIGHVTGVDMTSEQREKADRLRSESGFDQVEFVEGRIEDLPFEDAAFDCIISNGVINLSPAKETVFAEAARVLRSGGRLAIADIVAEVELAERIVADTDLWASCIGGAAQVDNYQQAIEASHLTLEAVKENPYRFLSEQAQNACTRYGVKSVSLMARKVG